MPQELFATTRWSVVLAAAGPGSPDATRAMGELCQAYWYPLYAFVRRQGFDTQDAEDITQAFFARFLEKDSLTGVGPAKGRFRAFLLVCLKRFIANWRESAGALKRGGGKSVVSIDVDDAEQRYRREPQHAITPERVFDRHWALTVLERSLATVAGEYAGRGKQEVFEILKVYLAADQAAPPFMETAAKLGITESAAKVAAYRLRQRYRLAVEREIADTLSDESELEQEIGSLLEAVSKGHGG